MIVRTTLKSRGVKDGRSEGRNVRLDTDVSQPKWVSFRICHWIRDIFRDLGYADSPR